MEAGITNNTEGRRIRNAKVTYDMEISTVGRNDFVIGNTSRSDISFLCDEESCVEIRIQRTKDGFEASCESDSFKYYINGVEAESGVNAFKINSFLTVGNVSFFLRVGA